MDLSLAQTVRLADSIAQNSVALSFHRLHVDAASFMWHMFVPYEKYRNEEEKNKINFELNNGVCTQRGAKHTDKIDEQTQKFELKHALFN